MSRLDHHVAIVRNKLALNRFLHALAWTTLVASAAVLVAVLVDKLFQVRPPHWQVWLYATAGVAVVAALAYALWRRPSAKDAAVAIDDKLGLKEKFSTALYVRPVNDPFAKAAVRDAEVTADRVSLRKHFPLSFPRASYGTVVLAAVAGLVAWQMKPMDLFGKEQARKQAIQEEIKREDAKKVVQQALAQVSAMPKVVADNEAVKLAKADLEKMLQQPVKDPEQVKRSAAKALQDVSSAIKNQIQQNQKFADAQNDMKMFKSLMPADEDKGPVADAQRNLAKGSFSEAVQELQNAVDNFDKMDKEDQAKAAQQMQNMAKQLEQMANDPKQQQQIQQQLQQMGMNQQQAQQAQKLMQQAAQGNQQAQQQLQQMAQQMMQQMNNGQGPNPQQQQQIQQMMQQMQAQANAQQQAQQMAQAAQQMAQAMQQAQQGGQNPQQAGNQQQQMQQGMAGMQQMMQQMQAIQNDAQQVQAAQQAAQAAAQQAAGQLGQQGGQGGGQQGQQGQNGMWAGQGRGWQPGDPGGQFNGPNNGMGGAGIGAGDRSAKSVAPYGVKQEVSRPDDIEGGKILANMMVKADALKGESKATLREIAANAEQQATDEVEQERIGRQAQQAVKDYFRSMEQDAQ